MLAEAWSCRGSIGFREGIAWSQEQLGLLALEGRLDAEAQLRSSFATHRELRDRWRMASVLEDLAARSRAASPFLGGRAAWLLARPRRCARRSARCSRRASARSTTVRAAARAALGDAAFEAAWERGGLRTRRT